MNRLDCARRVRPHGRVRKRHGARTALLALCAVLSAAPLVHAQSDAGRLQEDPEHIRTWNRFAEALHTLHTHRVDRHEVETETSAGGYGSRSGKPGFYREVEYRDKDSGRLLSRIKWERENPDRIHVIEVFIHDEEGRVVRDYVAAYLPNFRNAPAQTLINFHHYEGDLHAFRQFDASGDRLYQRCQGEYDGESVFISLEEDDLPPYSEPAAAGTPVYRACFDALPDKAGKYLDPLSEIDAEGTHSSARIEAEIATLNRLIGSHPRDARLYTDRARLLMEHRAHRAALADIRTALELDEDLDEAYFLKGMVLGREKRLDEAIAALSVYLERNPKDSHAYTKRGVRHMWNGDRQAAQRDFERAIELNPDNAEAHDDLGVIHASRGSLDQALRHFRRTVSIDPTYQKGHHNLALALHLKGQSEKALTAVDEAIRLAPKHPNSLRLKGEILRTLGEQDKAQALFERAATLPDPTNWSERYPLR